MKERKNMFELICMSLLGVAYVNACIEEAAEENPEPEDTDAEDPGSADDMEESAETVSAASDRDLNRASLIMISSPIRLYC